MNYDEIASTQSILKFLDYYQITNDQGEVLDFKDHAFLWDIYKDFSPKQAIRKAAQIGFSTTANIKALWLAKHRGMDIIYTLPSAADIKDFVSGKTNRLIANNHIFQEWTEDKDSIEQKRVGSNVIYFKGTWTERAAIATPADLYISDETDRSKQDIVKQYQTRLQHSKYAWEWYFSNPSAPGNGVDYYWSLSDQKHWFVPCESCATWQEGLTMKNIMGNPPYFGCVKCGKELDRRSRKSQWVSKWENKDVSGYWISSLMNPRLSAGAILKRKNDYTEEQFSNFVLGEPYVGKGNTLSRQAFYQNVNSLVNSQKKPIVIGVDTGVNINVVAGNEDGIFYYDKSDNYGTVYSLLRRFPDSIAVIDEGGDITAPRKLMEEFPHRVYLCYFRQDTKTEEIWSWTKNENTVRCDRNRGLQLVIDEFTEKRIPINAPDGADDWNDYYDEWKGMYRTVEETSLGTQRYVWNKPSSGRCDYPFATLYWRIGMDKIGGDYIKFVDADEDTFARRGIDPKDSPMRFLPKWGNRFPS